MRTVDNDFSSFAEAIELWVNSKEGQEKFESARKSVDETKRKLAAERTIDPLMFRMPLAV